MSIQQKISQYQGLTEYETSIIDSLPTSEYFKVFGLEDTIPGGRSTFQILGSEFLEDGVEIKIELLDINGNPIYTEPIKYLDSLVSPTSVQLVPSHNSVRFLTPGLGHV